MSTYDEKVRELQIPVRRFLAHGFVPQRADVERLVYFSQRARDHGQQQIHVIDYLALVRFAAEEVIHRCVWATEESLRKGLRAVRHSLRADD
jgi:hypothetical protein